MSKVCRYVTNKLPAKPHRPGHRQRYRTDTDTDTDTNIDIDIDKSKSRSQSQSQKPYVKREITLHFIFKPLWDL